MTGTDFCVNKPHMSRSYLNHLVRLTILRTNFFRYAIGDKMTIILGNE